MNNFILTLPCPPPGFTKNQPFPSGIQGCTNFRIPSLTVLRNGTIIAACDARWNHDGDGAGVDTIVSTSTDGGKNWHYQFANYLGDNGNQFNDLSTSFLDGALSAIGRQVHLIVDLFPAGFALNTSRYRPSAGQNGLDQTGNLRLRLLTEDLFFIGEDAYGQFAANADYRYYLNLADYGIYSYNGNTKVKGYHVDPWFFITCPDGKVTNLFFADSPFQPYPTNYLYHTRSNDNGQSWTAPKLINLKEESEQTLLIGPGNGTADPVTGNLIFTAYEHTQGFERACLIWMDHSGNWNRTENATSDTWSSESTPVVLSDGTVRLFFRDGHSTLRYTDYQWDGTQYILSNRMAVDTGIPKTSHNQLSAILYSKKYCGDDLILLSTAAGEGRMRTNGTIYTLRVSTDGSVNLLNTHRVTNGHFAYSCIAELQDGDIALLYECADAVIRFETIRSNLLIPAL